ncbi:MAG TPA: L,D-transpeptidase family protein [Stellaceae bacterium]|nr:L,D-transpeptidase family protein [Stellaceae bacterium]
MMWTLSGRWQRGRFFTESRGWRYLLPSLLAIAVSAVLPARATEFALSPGQTVVGQLQHYVIRKGEVFGDIARRFDVGYTELVEANPGVDPWIAPPGTQIVIPSLYVLPAVPHRGIVLNLGQYRLFYFPPGGDTVYTYPVGLGVIGWNTPMGETRIVRKEPHPVWIPPASMRRVEPDLPAIVPAGPDNPLGDYALHLGWPRVLIHGTDRPDGVGRNVSHGCVHLYPEDIAQLFHMVHVGTPVRTLNDPAVAAWAGNQLYLMVHPSQKQVQQVDIDQPVTADPAAGVRRLVELVAGQYAGAVDWGAVDRAAAERTDMPVVVANRSAYVAEAPQPYGAGQPQQPYGAPPPAYGAAPALPANGPGAPQDFGREVEAAYARALAMQRAHQPPQSGASDNGETAEPVGDGAQYPYADPAQPAAAQQSFERAMQSFERDESPGSRNPE